MKTTKNDDDQKWRQPKIKMIKSEDDQTWRWPKNEDDQKKKTTKNEDDQQMCSKLGGKIQKVLIYVLFNIKKFLILKASKLGG